MRPDSADALADGPGCELCRGRCCPSDQTCAVGDAGVETCVRTCSAPADCPQGACAPKTNDAGVPVGPFICKPNDGQEYHGCRGILSKCDGAYCCVKDRFDNEFCARPCTSPAECGGARCIAYTFDLGCMTASAACGP